MKILGQIIKESRSNDYHGQLFTKNDIKWIKGDDGRYSKTKVKPFYVEKLGSDGIIKLKKGNLDSNISKMKNEISKFHKIANIEDFEFKIFDGNKEIYSSF